MFAGVVGGINRIIEALEKDLTARGVEIRRKLAVRRITRTPAGYALEAGPVPAPTLIEADAVIIAVPATPAARMLADLVPAASTELATIEYASMAIVTLAVRKQDWPAGATGSGFLVPSVEGRTIKASTYSHAKWEWSGEAGGRAGRTACLGRTARRGVRAAAVR